MLCAPSDPSPTHWASALLSCAFLCRSLFLSSTVRLHCGAILSVCSDASCLPGRHPAMPGASHMPMRLLHQICIGTSKQARLRVLWRSLYRLLPAVDLASPCRHCCNRHEQLVAGCSKTLWLLACRCHRKCCWWKMLLASRARRLAASWHQPWPRPDLSCRFSTCRVSEESCFAACLRTGWGLTLPPGL